MDLASLPNGGFLGLLGPAYLTIFFLISLSWIISSILSLLLYCGNHLHNISFYFCYLLVDLKFKRTPLAAFLMYNSFSCLSAPFDIILWLERMLPIGLLIAVYM